MSDAKVFRDCPECKGAGVIRKYPPLTTVEIDLSASVQSLSVEVITEPCEACATRYARMKAFEGREMPKDENGKLAFKTISDLAWWLNSNMAEGNAIAIEQPILDGLDYNYRAYPTRRDALMSNLMGASHGAWLLESNFDDDRIIIRRQVPGDKWTYIDPDRRDLFRRLPDGTFEPISEAVTAYLAARRTPSTTKGE